MSHIVCKATKKNGEPCRITARINEDGLCWWHDPARKAEREAFQQKGREGRRKVSKPGPLLDLETIRQARAWVFQELMLGNLNRDESKMMLAVIDSQEKALRDQELEHLKSLAESLAESTPGRG